MSLTYEKAKKLELDKLYSRKATRISRIEMLKTEIKTIDKVIKEKEEKYG